MSKEIETKEIKVLEKQVTEWEDKANRIQITNNKEYSDAGQLLVTQIKAKGKEIKLKKEEITKPLSEALKATRALFKPVEDKFAVVEEIVKTKMLDYNKAVAEEARKQEEKNRKEEERLQARVEKGTLKQETADKKLEEQVEVVQEKQVRSDAGMVSTKKIKKVRLTDKSKIPEKYLEVNMVMVRKDVLAGIEVPGAEMYEDEVLSTSLF